MSTRVYTGARYVPIFKGQWNNELEYEPLSIVQYEGNSYTSKQHVPIGIAITNEDFWAITGNYNAQVEAYRQEVRAYDARITDAQDDATEALRQIAAVAEQITGIETDVSDFKEEVNTTISDFKEEVNTTISDFELDVNNDIAEIREIAQSGEIELADFEPAVAQSPKELNSLLEQLITYSVNNEEQIMLQGVELDTIFDSNDIVNGMLDTAEIPKPFNMAPTSTTGAPTVTNEEHYAGSYALKFSRNNGSCYYQYNGFLNNLDNESKYFAAMKYKTNGYNGGGQIGAQNLIASYVSRDTPTTDWQTISAYGLKSEKDRPENANLFLGALPRTSTAASAGYNLTFSGTAYITSLVFLNLTEIFGAGNEPSQNQITLAYDIYCTRRNEDAAYSKQFKIKQEPIVNTTDESEIVSYRTEMVNTLASLLVTDGTYNSPSGYPNELGSNQLGIEHLTKIGLAAFTRPNVIKWCSHISQTVNTYGSRDSARILLRNASEGESPNIYYYDPLWVQDFGSNPFISKLLAGKGGSLSRGNISGGAIINWCGLSVTPRNTTSEYFSTSLISILGATSLSERNDLIVACQNIAMQLNSTATPTPSATLSAAISRATDPVAVSVVQLPFAPEGLATQPISKMLINQKAYFANTYQDEGLLYNSASTIKLLLLYILDTNGYDLRDYIEIDDYDSSFGNAVGGSEAFFNVGDKLTLNDAAFAIAMLSDNESATSVARYIGRKRIEANYL